MSAFKSAFFTALKSRSLTSQRTRKGHQKIIYQSESLTFEEKLRKKDQDIICFEVLKQTKQQISYELMIKMVLDIQEEVRKLRKNNKDNRKTLFCRGNRIETDGLPKKRSQRILKQFAMPKQLIIKLSKKAEKTRQKQKKQKSVRKNSSIKWNQEKVDDSMIIRSKKLKIQNKIGAKDNDIGNYRTHICKICQKFQNLKKNRVAIRRSQKTKKKTTSPKTKKIKRR